MHYILFIGFFMIDGNQKFILNRLQCLKDVELKKIYLGLPGISPPDNAVFLPFNRINIILSGSKKICLPTEKGPSCLSFTKGDIQFSPANTWELQYWDSKCELICIVQRQDYLRVSHYTVKGDIPGKNDNQYFHTHRPYNDSFLFAFRALSSLSRFSDMSIFLHLIKAIIYYSIEECSRPVEKHGGKADFTFQSIRKYVDNSFQEDIDRESIAKRFFITPGYLSQLFKRKTNSSFISYITDCRLEFSKYLLKNTDIPVYQVADQAGFRNYVHFVRRFRECCGIPPGKYREANGVGSK